MIPRVLIFHTLDWPNAARLAIAFRAANCRVHALCRPSHPLRVVSGLDSIHALSLFNPQKSLRAAIKSAEPDFIVPCDDTAVMHLHRLYREENASGSASPSPITALIERSLGNPAAYNQIELRSKLPAIAAATDALLPRTKIIATLEELRTWTEEIGFPAVLKTDRSWGGEGVVIAENLTDAQSAFCAMTRRPNWIRAGKRVLFNRDPNLLFRKFAEVPTITVQEFIPGTLANTAAACWNGETLAALSVEVVASFCELGSSTVVHPVENPQMRETAEQIARQLGISGFCGFDFILQQHTGRAYLLEINPRATQINHLILGSGYDLPGALRAKIAGEPARQPLAVTSAQTISLFPQEFKRDPASSFLASGYHDIPFEEPALIKAFESAPTTLRRSKGSALLNRYVYPKPDVLRTVR